jgi:hypothetical protein
MIYLVEPVGLYMAIIERGIVIYNPKATSRFMNTVVCDGGGGAE